MFKRKLNDQWLFVCDGGGNLSSMIHGSNTDGQIVHLPHDAMIHEKRQKDTPNGAQTGFHPGGVYEYYKKIFIPKEWEQKKVILEFEGVYMNSKVYINGVLAASCYSGYSNFYVDTDGYLAYGKENQIKVLVNNSAIPNSRWYSGSGIYRNVNLLMSDRVHIAVNGVRVTTKHADERSAEIVVETVVENEGCLPKMAHLNVIIEDDKGNTVAADEIQVTAYRNESIKNIQRLCIDDPKLWSCENPALYKYKVQLLEDGSAIDEECGNFGIRTLGLSAKYGLRINGKETKLRGTCVHHDNGILGACAFEAAEERKCRQLKEAGFNCIRSAHNQISKAMLDACDKVGMLVMDELYDMWTQPKNPNDYSQYFMENWERDVELMVDKDYNHPSVILYSMGNEIPEVGTAKGASLNRKISNKIKSLDDTRYTTNAINGLLAASGKLREIFTDIEGNMQKEEKDGGGEKKPKAAAEGGSNELNSMMAMLVGPMADALAAHEIMTECIEECASAMDVAGFNYMTGRHVLEHDIHPNRVVMGAETYPPDIVRLWDIVKNNHHVIGDMTWTGYDYLGEAGIGIFYYDGTRNFSNHWPDLLADVGDIDITGYRRPISYLREIVYGLRKEPYIAVERMDRYGMNPSKTPWMFKDNMASWTWPGYESKPAVVDIYSDADEVELLLNGVSLGRKPAGGQHGFTATYEIQYHPGVLKAIAYRDSMEAEQFIIETSTDKVKIDAKAEKTELAADGEDLSYITLSLKDAAGKENMFIEKEVTISIEGPATIEGFGSAAPQTENSYDARTWKTYNGRLLAVVRSGYEEGEAVVTFSTEGCATGKVTIKVGNN